MPIISSEKKCSIIDCDRPNRCRGMCDRHYRRALSNGEIELIQKKYKNAEIAMQERTVWSDGCLIWTGARDPRGYGNLQIKGVRTYAHRFAYQMAYGDIPSGMYVDHLCHNPSCCNPEHLRLANHAENIRNRRGSTRNSKSGVRGVVWDLRRGKWVAQVSMLEKTYRQRHESMAEAIADVERVRELWFGRFAGKPINYTAPAERPQL